MTECWFDGSITLNPGGRATCSAIIKRDGLTIHAEHSLVNEGPGASVNTAEYGGVIAVLKYLETNGIKEATIYGDSLLVINQLNRVWKPTKSKLYYPFWYKAESLVPVPRPLTFVWIPREENKAADALASPYFIK